MASFSRVVAPCRAKHGARSFRFQFKLGKCAARRGTAESIALVFGKKAVQVLDLSHAPVIIIAVTQGRIAHVQKATLMLFESQMFRFGRLHEIQRMLE